jgi:ATP/maltotriose-dependent transcriptional regulator MalT
MDDRAAAWPVPRVKVTAPGVRGLYRQRLIGMLDAIGERRVALVVAPAGSGKTTLLAQFAATSPLPVAWYRAESEDAPAGAVVRGLAAALSGVVEMAEEPHSLNDVVTLLDRWPGEGAVLVIDDLHSLAGTEGEAIVEELLRHAPPRLCLALASRSLPDFDLSRLRVGLLR